MAFKFDCSNCGSPIMVKFLMPGERAWCKKCGAETVIPETAMTVDEEPHKHFQEEKSSKTVTEQDIGDERQLHSLGKLIALTFGEFGSHAKLYISLAVIPIILRVMGDIPSLPTVSLLRSQSISFSAISFAMELAFTILVIMAELPIIIAAYENSGKSSVRLTQYYKRAIPVMIPYLITSIILALLFITSLVCLIIPGIIVLVWFYFAAYYAAIERKYYFKAFSASVSLVKHRWWKIFGRVILPALIIILLSIFDIYFYEKIKGAGSDGYSILFIIIMNSVISLFSVWDIIFGIILFKDLRNEDTTQSQEIINEITAT